MLIHLPIWFVGTFVKNTSDKKKCTKVPLWGGGVQMGAVTRHLVNAKVDGAFLDCLLLSAEINGTQPSTNHNYVNTITVTSVYLEDYELWHSAWDCQVDE